MVEQENRKEFLEVLDQYEREFFEYDDALELYLKVICSYEILAHIDEDLMHEFAQDILDKSDDLEALKEALRKYLPLFRSKV